MYGKCLSFCLMSASFTGFPWLDISLGASVTIVINKIQLCYYACFVNANWL